MFAAPPAGILAKVRSVAVLLALSGAAACDMRPLTSTELHGQAANHTVDARIPFSTDAAVPVEVADSVDAGAAIDGAVVADASPDVGPLPASCFFAQCLPGLVWDAAKAECVARSDGFLSGQVRNRCTMVTLAALLGINNQHQCGFEGKGSFTFSGLPVCRRLTLTAAKPGYKAFAVTVVVEPTGTAEVIVALDPEAGCGAARPTDVPCRCVGMGCP